MHSLQVLSRAQRIPPREQVIGHRRQLGSREAFGQFSPGAKRRGASHAVDFDDILVLNVQTTPDHTCSADANVRSRHAHDRLVQGVLRQWPGQREALQNGGRRPAAECAVGEGPEKRPDALTVIMVSGYHPHPTKRRVPRRRSQGAGREPILCRFGEREGRGRSAGHRGRRHPSSCRSRHPRRRASPQPEREGSISVAWSALKRQKLTPHARENAPRRTGAAGAARPPAVPRRRGRTTGGGSRSGRRPHRGPPRPRPSRGSGRRARARSSA